eukprot:CAMPEP_0185199866 /NCGR_PEP_ID=MMETSP1140-20130426/46044_1 /TAXON_ID=298111 /ORGANISM="Pavlova sp., Strain CCMP459" /LENGTH=44 /DNA_ID= /DNA_START= /DNA_END= /DNA_ORIENTATION=
MTLSHHAAVVRADVSTASCAPKHLAPRRCWTIPAAAAPLQATST